jgi:hypothetical protein
MMDGLLVVCLTGICASPDPLSFYASRSPHTPAGLSESAPTTSTSSSVSAIPSSGTGATPESSPAEVIAAPAPVERDDSPASGGAGPVMSRATVATLVKGKLDGVRRCYEKGLADDPTFGGTVEMGWKIDVTGRVTSTNVVTATDRNPVVEECLRAEIMRWSFPASAEPVVVGSYPFTFDAALLHHRDTRGHTPFPPLRSR